MLKRWGIIALILIPLILSAEGMIGYIDSQRILEGYRGSGEITQEINTALRNWEREATGLKQEIEQMIQEYESQAVMLSEKVRQGKMAAIEEKQQEYQRFIQRIWGAGGEAEIKQREIMQPFVDRINGIITQIGETEGYSMIFDIASMGVVYANDELDLTQRVLDELNREYVGEKEVFAGFEKIEFYVLKLKEKNKEAQDFGLGQNIKEKLRAALIAMENYKEVRSTKMANAFTLANVPLAQDELTEEEVKTLGRLADADFMIMGEVEKVGEVITARISVIDVKKEAIIKTAEAKSSGDRPEDIITMVSDLTAEILPSIKVE
ncbi:MAG: OmpH family outer membrane protein [candidate division WOR-3 bacterium]|nr:OmpH family outer membrane protein [candidate division WOR-3 bacterium]